MVSHPNRSKKLIRYSGFDGNGIPRVWGEHETSHEVAEARCMDAAKDYVKRRPDTGPLSRWTFTPNQRRRAA